VSVTLSSIEGRYQVIARIASGGMGEVFRAHDAVLGREVAVKILHGQLAGDRGFVDRFRREARAAATLNHPNIVGVYDWGRAEGMYFMVMELVQGLNLRTLLTEYGHLEPAQVAEISLAILAALEHAHGHGIVHRDVKPENILIARDGSVKVADFGLARAYAESTVSQAEGTVTGTVQYLAPEQIEGGPADPRTDLYALGVVMFELLTGRPPFTGETSLAIAYQHLSSRVPPVSSLVPSLPRAFDRAIHQATSRDREDRPSSAPAMARQIVLAAADLPPAPSLAALAEPIAALPPIEEERSTTVTIPRSISPRARRARRLRLVATIAGLVMLVGLGAWTAWVYAVPHYAFVPKVVGLTEQEASAALRAAGLTVRIAPGQHSTTVEAGVVLAAEPPPGTKLRKGDAVVLTPSLGKVFVAIPSVTGLTEDAATKALKDAGFQVVVVKAFDEFTEKGSVVSQNPQAATSVEQGTTVTITISRGPPLIQVPDLTNQSKADAKAALQNLGFVVKFTQEFSIDVANGNVIRTNPLAGTRAPKGDTVTVVLSNGPKPVVMINVVGLTQADATSALQRLGLLVNVITVPYPGTPGLVFAQAPLEGVTIHEGDSVTIYVSGPQP
jgi:beta-lactam-binding protein with PASTA domain